MKGGHMATQGRWIPLNARCRACGGDRFLDSAELSIDGKQLRFNTGCPLCRTTGTVYLSIADTLLSAERGQDIPEGVEIDLEGVTAVGEVM